MPRTKEQYEEMRNATRQKIQSAGMRLFVQKGFGSTNVQDIADAAGISIGLLYRHYKTKDSLFNELVEFALNGLTQIIQTFEDADSPKKLMTQFVDEIYHDMQEGEELANLLILMNQLFFSGDGANRKQAEVLEVNGRLLRSTAALIKKGQESGDFRSGDAHEMAVLFYSALQGLADMKAIMKNNFVMPSPSVLTLFLFKEVE
ncbi:TetR/AcrR family transcriptional regulator [Paenibacillus sp. FSL H8-0457]|uniref:TetR/AcrR family transcriptional regulator n=1 Tax=unclassified Paenibacillus TaxID=185978 RepID=UPI0001787F67|nr:MULTISPECIES: TetR/AcrR family transcriptional regulator [unclassified Paenibacillus]ACX65032.1 transcriptional regulator, TetR family [Paenibacillus sp. Y412MC10]ETT62299.1 TetR family transcriptional regulator [Paenibacillus sp. FSL H8-457]